MLRNVKSRLEKKKNKGLYNPTAKEVSIIDIPEMNYLMIDGKGDPNTSKEYQEAIEALFSASFKIKFISAKEASQDYVVMPLEGLWWVENMENFNILDKSNRKWTAMIRQPDFITKNMMEKAIEEVEKKKNLPALSRIRFESLHEGLSAQIMHLGPYSEEEPTIKRLHGFIEANGYEFDGIMPGEKHHEIYLSDVRRTKPEKLKTIIR
ncbi:GyrI-like domain-containing protein [Methanosarcina sp.]|uniref:GyrI-like domain-containing protein n=1 Tax=Methanosarcina sp. TaxID=2213 RepID=UPI002AB8EA6E|nr:GyrI-like domain-containing protein [Methanosarcina sp.]MDY9926249.1 GyrI-like domain-containing protein [Methanosarcina sp.]